MKSQYRIATAVAAMALATSAMAAQDTSLIRITRQNQLAHDARQAKLAAAGSAQAQAAKPQAPAKPQADQQPVHAAAARERATAAHAQAATGSGS